MENRNTIAEDKDYNTRKYIINYLSEVKTICDTLSPSGICEFINLIELLKNRNGRLFVLGVGGSAANASHAVNDFRKILNIETYAANENSAELTARINDDGWETSYVNWLKVSKFDYNDGLLVFSVGGGSSTTSLNLVRCMEYAKNIQSGYSIGKVNPSPMILSVVSRDGGKAKELSDSCILIPTISEARITPHAEEWQGIILHLVVNALCKK
jgi:D-sedoheptulose 7-phosphate isomerase